MKWKTRLVAVFRSCLGTALSLTLLSGTVPVQAAESSPTDYIVKYRESASEVMGEDSAVPFDVVNEARFVSLLGQDLIEWFEPDGEAVLIDPFPAETETAAFLQGALSPWYADEMWHLDMIGAETAYTLDAVGEGVRVAVIDSGVNPHPDLAGCLAEGWNYINQSASTGDANGHGTAVAGMIAGSGEKGMVGTSPKATLIPLKCFDGTTTQVSLVCQAIWGAVDDYDCDVISLSVGILHDSVALQKAIAHAVENGVIVVAAAGNGGTRTKYYPAAYDTVIGVGEVDSAGVVYKGSNHNDSVFLTAPGAEVTSLDRFGGYDTFTGCSYAAPLVTGAVADLLSLEPDLTRQEVSAILSETAMDRGKTGWDEYYGWGILNLRGCVLALSEGFRLSCRETENGQPCARAVNQTGEKAVCVLLSAGYDGDGRQTGVFMKTLCLPPGGQETVKLPKGTGKVFLCDEGFRPLTPALELGSASE